MDAAEGDTLMVHAAHRDLGEGGRVKFVDEFRDAELGRALAGADPRRWSSRAATTR